MRKYDIAVIGGGAAGCMAAIRCGQLKKKVALLERNDSLGRKILLTSNGRCNITNVNPIEGFINKFIPHGEFYRTAFHNFSNTDLMDFFRAKGLEFKIENRGRVLPVTDKASSVIQVLEKYLKENSVDIIYGNRTVSIDKKEDCFVMRGQNGNEVKSKKIIISTGGISYKTTGSTGDGFDIARKFGHKISEIKPALVPLKTEESFVKELQGLSFENAQISVYNNDKKNISEIGEIIITHFGISGPLVLDISGEVVSLLKKQAVVKITIDLMPDVKRGQLEINLAEKFTANGKSQIKNIMQEIMPKRMAPVFLSILKIIPQKLVSQINKKERSAIVNIIKALPLTITGSLSMDEAMVTSGGVLLKEINPRTMESKIVPGLYFAGEILEACGLSGGYNLQQAFSTGYLAGENASL